MDTQQEISLGFAALRMPVGTHICQIYQTENERSDSLLSFLLQGVADGERCACFSDRTSMGDVEEYLARHGRDLEAVRARGRLSLSSAAAVYFQGGEFVPERMLALLKKFHDDAVADGHSAARVIGEMSSHIHEIKGGSRLLEYECRVSLLLRDYPLSAVCQYDAHAFDGATIMDILKVHPMMVVRGSIVQNPYFVPPEELLGQVHD